MAGAVKGTPERPAVIEVRDVCFGYGADETLHNVGFKVRARDMVAVVGPNGGGKTTLLRLLLGLLAPRWGTVRVLGGDPRRASRRIGYVPQRLECDPRFPVTVSDVVSMGRVEAHRFGPYRAADRGAVERALAQVGMEGLARRPFARLSGGERQRVLIAQALVSDPAVLLLDEPTANVDPAAEHRLFELFRALNERLTLMLVSHNVNVVTRHVSHVLCVNRTAEMHPIEALLSSEFRESYGGEMAVILHDVQCHVVDRSRVLATGHRGEAGEGR